MGMGDPGKGLLMRVKSTDGEILRLVASKIGGEVAVKLVSELKKRGRATEDDLAKNTNIKLNELRKTLFTLQKFSIITPEIVQDKGSGWMIFYWRLREDQLESIIRTQKRRVLEKLRERLEYEREHDFYVCVNPRCGVRYTFEEAMERMFRCSKCGSPLEHYDNTQIIAVLEDKIAKLEAEIKRE
ncbi:MAG: transcription factor [Candidatus Hecatellales archaeon]|nr:MAG: transcription factor [Candidatus Hecatellales archaeon]